MKLAHLCLLSAVIMGLVCWAPAVAQEPAKDPGPAGVAVSSLPQPSADPAQAGLSKLGETIPDWRARWELARLLSYTKQYDRAISEYRKVLEDKPDNWQARAELAQVLFWAGKRQEALGEMERLPLAEMTPETILLRAELLTADKQYAQAEKLFKQYLDQRPGDAAVQLKLAQVLSWDGRYKESLTLYRLLLAKSPNDRQLRRHYALVLSWDGQTEEAIKELEKSLKD